ncbi:MAG: hypothetical protein UDG86_06845 [Lachnospiraceae bacterium]|jgi:hypothetical protein|nr:hypothetical protein [Lachnospiraceae bacterium]
MAKAHGPNRSPAVLDTWRADSAKKDAHWEMACSDAPEQIINRRNIQKSFMEKSWLTAMGLCPSPMVLRGTLAKSRALHSGMMAQSEARMRQPEIPTVTKKRSGAYMRAYHTDTVADFVQRNGKLCLEGQKKQRSQIVDALVSNCTFVVHVVRL